MWRGPEAGADKTARKVFIFPLGQGKKKYIYIYFPPSKWVLYVCVYGNVCGDVCVWGCMCGVYPVMVCATRGDRQRGPRPKKAAADWNTGETKNDCH